MVTWLMLGSDAAGTDDGYWGGDKNIPSPRPAYAITSAKPGTDVAASTAAAFASCSLLYSSRSLSVSSPPTTPPSLTDTTYASTLLIHSRQLLNLAANATGGQQFYQQAVPAAGDFYLSTSMGDDLVLAALFLAYADNSPVLFSQAQKWWDKHQLTATGELSWDSKAPALPILFSQLLTLKPDLGTRNDLNRWKKEAEITLDSVVAADRTPGGLIWYGGASDFCSLVPALNAAMLLIRYAPLASSSEKTNNYIVLRSLFRIDLALTCVSRRLQRLNWITLWEKTPCTVRLYLLVNCALVDYNFV
jgi:endoglucanase